MWDGSSLPPFEESDILERHELEASPSSSEESSPQRKRYSPPKRPRKNDYWFCSIHGRPQWVLARPLKNTFPLIFDELKPLFGLPKIGLHLARLKTKRYILCRLENSSDRGSLPVRDLRLDEAPVPMREDGFFRQLVQATYCFRMVCAMTMSHDSSIVVRRLNEWSVPVSWRENNVNFRKNRFTKATIDRWFGEDVRPDFVFQKMLRIEGLAPDEETGKMLALRGKIESVIERIDKNEIWISSYILERINEALSARPWIRDVTPQAIRLEHARAALCPSKTLVEEAIEKVELPAKQSRKRGKKTTKA